MKRKLFACLFVIFVLLAGFAGYKVITDQLDYRNATNYYDSLSDSWVQANPHASAPADAEPVEEQPAAGSGSSASCLTDRIIQFLFPVAAADSAASEEAIPAAAPAEDPAEEIPADDAPVELPEEDAESEQDEEEPSQDEVVWTRFTEEEPPIVVDFEGLLGENPEIIGWIYSEGTNINYPVLQTTDNEKYLDRQPDGTKSRNGSIFMDYICDADFSAFNTLIYGHNRKDVMFSSLLNYGSQEYYEAHPVIWLLMTDGNYKLDLFAGMVVDPNSRVYLPEFADDEDRRAFIDECLAASDFRASVTPEPGDRLVTLSTCNNTYNGMRYVVLGVLSRCGQPAD